MAFTAIAAGDVEAWAGLAPGALDADLLGRVIDAVNTHAARHYTIDDVDDGGPVDAERDQALLMQAHRLYQRKHSPGGYSGADELGPIKVQAFDVDVQRLLAGRLIVAGIFGPSETTAAAEEV